MMNVIECINSRRSTRSFTEQEVEAAKINQLITLGTKAATGSGNEAWGFAVLTNKNELKRLSDEIKSYLRENLEKYPYFQQYESWVNNEKYNFFYDAPCLLLIYGDTNSHWNVYDCTLAAGNIMLAAGDLGLGTCWIGFAEHICDTYDFKSQHNIPDNYNLVCTMILGYPKVQLAPPKRKPAQIFFQG